MHAKLYLLELINRRRVLRTAEMRNEIIRRQNIQVPVPRPRSSVMSKMFNLGRSKTTI
jgi:hypothetical protein